MTAEAARRPVSLRRQAVGLVLGIAAPIAIYYVLHGAGVSNIVALAAGALLPACSTVFNALVRRRLDAVAILVLASFVISIAASLATHNSRFLLAKDGLITAIWGLWFFASLQSQRPAAYELARPLMEGRRMFGIRSWESIWVEQPQFRRIWRVASVIWGLALVLDAVIRVVISYSLPVHTVPALGGILWPVTLVLIQIVTNVYYHRAGLYRLLGAPWIRTA